MKRQITKKQEQVYRCRHHDFEGLTVKQTAAKLEISTSTVREHLTNLKKRAPQLFPILTLEQAEIWSLWFDGGLSNKEIAERFETTERTIEARLQVIKHKMDYDEKINSRARKMLSLDVGVDETEIINKF